MQTPGERYSEGLRITQQIQQVTDWRTRCRNQQEVQVVMQFQSRGLRFASSRTLQWLREIHQHVKTTRPSSTGAR